MNSNTSNKSIAKNTLYLYVRTAITMLVSLYASRVVLSQLGVTDYGIYNVVGGVVSMLTMLSGTLAGATQRYISVGIGKKDHKYLSRVFSASFKIHILLSVIILIVAETLGLWFVNYKMITPADRLLAANMVFQTSVISFVFNILYIPYNAAVISYERFRFYALVDISRSVLNLMFISLLVIIPYDHLVAYGVMQLLISMYVMLLYVGYVKKNFIYCNAKGRVEKKLLKELLSFTGWNFLGTASSVIYIQGSSIILNIFRGVLLNAAMGVANQVTAAVTSFVSNFTIAVNPQITKTYAAHELLRTNELVFLGAKISAFLLLIVGSPIIVNIDYILHIWLTVVPEYTSEFIVSALLAAFVTAFNNPFNCLIFATGNIKNYQMSCVIINVMFTLFLYICLSLGFNACCIFVIMALQSTVKLVVMLFLVKKATDFPVLNFMFNVYIRNITFAILVGVVLFLKNEYMPKTTAFLFILESLLCILCIILVLYNFGLNASEKQVIKGLFLQKIKRR